MAEQLVGGDQPRKAAVAVGYRMDREQVDHQCADQHQRVRAVALGDRVPVERLAEQELGVLRGRGFEPDLAMAVLVRDDVIRVGFEITTTATGVQE